MFLRRVLHLLTIFMSLTVTPLLIFISPSTMLYFGNQDDLGRQIAVLYPFVAMFIVMLLLGLALYSLSRYRPFRALLWSYYVIGPIFFLFYVIHRMPVSFLDTLPCILLILCLFLVLVIILTIKVNPRSVIGALAILGLLLISNEVYQFCSKYDPSVAYSLTGNIITSSDGEKYPLIKGALKGHLSKAKAYEGGLTLAGWIFDVKNFQLPEAILVFDDKKFIFSGRMNKDRPDVVKVFPDYPLKTGFHFVLPLRLIQDLDNSRVHLFALLKSGEACEIPYARGLNSPIYTQPGRRDRVSRGAALPNIYHIIFDEYQTDMFDLTLSRDVKENLKDFIYFPENTTLFGRTAMSLASMFSGRSYDLKSPQGNYLWNAYNTDASMLHWLKMVGYSTYGYLYPVYRFPLSLFDVTIDFKEHARVAIAGQRAVFSSLWIYANLPYFMAEWLIDRDELDQLKNQNLVSGSANITSLVSFRNYLEDEKHLPGSNRYTFIHLLIPHFPYIFRSDCSYDKDLKGTSPIEQSRCATQLIVDFVKTLKELGRFNDSLILICADHGGRFEIKNGRLKGVEHLGLYSKRWSRARSRALLLIKPPGGNGNESFVVSHAESSLLDIAPTIFACINYRTNMAFEGVSLLDFVNSPLKRQRDYYFFDKKRRDKWSDEGTDEMARFTINDGQFSSPEFIKISQ